MPTIATSRLITGYPPHPRRATPAAPRRCAAPAAAAAPPGPVTWTSSPGTPGWSPRPGRGHRRHLVHGRGPVADGRVDLGLVHAAAGHGREPLVAEHVLAPHQLGHPLPLAIAAGVDVHVVARPVRRTGVDVGRRGG